MFSIGLLLSTKKRGRNKEFWPKYYIIGWENGKSILNLIAEFYHLLVLRFYMYTRFLISTT